MLTFRYRAAAMDGSVVTGTMLGSDRAEVVARLHDAGQVPIRVDEQRTMTGRRRFEMPRRKAATSPEQIADFTRDLATLLRAGMTLDRALGMLATTCAGGPFAETLETLRQSVKQGSTLADAMSKHAGLFDHLYVGMIRAGESAGALESVLDRLATHLEKTRDIRDALVSALIYPAILIVVATISILILLAYVVPQFAEMFEGAGEVLPWSTRATIAAGEAVRRWGWLLLPVLGTGFLFMRRELREPANAVTWHTRILRLPIIGEILLKAEVARFARTLSTLLQNGITLLNALVTTAATLGNRRLAADIDKVAAGLKEGQRLADPLAEHTLFPPFAVHMIRVGEETGNLQAILEQVADTYERDTGLSIKRALALLEPALILVLGGIIAGVIISILVAILGINELVI